MIELLAGVLMTLKITVLSLILGGFGGLCLGILNCTIYRKPFLGFLIQGFIYLIRGTPLFVQVLIIYFGLGLDLTPFTAGIIALGINASAYVAEIIRGGLNAIPQGQWEAATVLGYSQRQTLWLLILPQTLRLVIPSLTNEATTLIKESSILMAIGVSELTKVGRDIVARELQPITVYLLVAALYFAMTTTVSLLVRGFEKK